MGSKQNDSLNPLVRFLLLVSSAAPVLLGLALGFISKSALDIKKICIGLVILVVGLLLSALTVFTVSRSFKKLERIPVAVSSVEPLDGQGLTQLLALLMPLLLIDTDKITITSALIAFGVFALMAFRSNSHHVHPVLMIAGYKVYRVMTSSGVGYIMISKDDIRRAKDIKEVGHCTDYLVVDLTNEPVMKV